MNTKKISNQAQTSTPLITKVSMLMLAFFLVLGMTACEQQQISPDPVKPGMNDGNEMGDGNTDQRSMTVNMTDAPGDFAELNVEIEKVEVYSESEGWVTLNAESQTHDVTELTNGKQVTIAGMAGLQAAFYTELRLTYGASSTVALEVVPGTTIDHSLAIQSETTLPIEADLTNESEATVLIDFHAAESVIESAGEYLLDPVVTWISDTTTGVQGRVEAETQAAIMLMAEGGNGEVNFSTFTDAQGDFLIRGAEEGTYEMLIQLRDGLGQLSETTIEGIVIVEGEIQNMGNLSVGE